MISNVAWQGEYTFLLSTLIQKDFKVRYRNMSLGVFWSLLNPLVTMAALTFVFTRIFSSPSRQFPVFVLCGLVPFNFFTLAWSAATSSLVENASIMKRVPIPRVTVPIATVLGNCVHLLIQIGLLLSFVLAFGNRINWYWLWLPVVWGFELVFVCGMALITSALNIFVRDTRYVVESVNTLLFWCVPIFYGFERIPPRFVELYRYNPIAALVMASRNILLDGVSPAPGLLLKLAFVSVLVLLLGLLVFRKLEPGFYEYL
ncbi:MAG: ABC transporter permease [Bryobacteraceae bacterium]|jgi:ABC-type polysaccharide/polyol phosphate export permease